MFLLDAGSDFCRICRFIEFSLYIFLYIIHSRRMFDSPSSGKKELVRRTSSYHTSGVGTQAYGAPEQLLHGIIDDKSDVYSLGIVLFEMFHPFGTTMERSREDTAFYRSFFIHWKPFIK